jgi:hypothetical protein
MGELLWLAAAPPTALGPSSMRKGFHDCVANLGQEMRPAVRSD